MLEAAKKVKTAIFGSVEGLGFIGRVPEYDGSPLDAERFRPGTVGDRATAPMPGTEELEVTLVAAQGVLHDVAAKRDALSAALASARDGAAAAEKAVEQAREAFGDGLAEQELHGSAAPPRDRLTAAEAALRDAEDRVRALERRQPEIERVWRAARLDVLTADEAVRRRRNTIRQAAIDALASERNAIDVRGGALSAEIHADLAEIATINREIAALRRSA